VEQTKDMSSFIEGRHAGRPVGLVRLPNILTGLTLAACVFFGASGACASTIPVENTPASIGKSADSEGLPPSRSHPKRPLTRSTPRWIVSAEAIALGRIGGGLSQTLVARVPGTVPFYGTFTALGTEAFNSNQFQQGFSAGPNISLIYHGDSGYGAELSYFNIVNQSTTKSHWPRRLLAGDEGSRQLLSNSRFRRPSNGMDIHHESL